MDLNKISFFCVKIKLFCLFHLLFVSDNKLTAFLSLHDHKLFIFWQLFGFLGLVTYLNQKSKISFYNVLGPMTKVIVNMNFWLKIFYDYSIFPTLSDSPWIMTCCNSVPWRKLLQYMPYTVLLTKDLARTQSFNQIAKTNS